MEGKKPKKPGPEAETLHYDMPWEKAIDKALSKKRPIGGFPKPPSRTVRPKRVPPPPKPEKPNRVLRLAPLTDPIEAAAANREARERKKGPRPSKDAIQAEMLRAHCTRVQAIANLKARSRAR